MKNVHVKHLIVGVAAAAIAALVEALTDPGTKWAHAAWAPFALTAASYLRTVLSAAPTAILALVMVASLSSCAHAPTPAPDCKTAAEALLGEVASALIQENWEQAVSSLVTDPHGGECAVELALQWIAASSGANAAAPNADSLEALKAGRAKAWLAAHAPTAATP